MYVYMLLTALTFYLCSPGVLVSLPSLGPLPPLAVHAALFAVVHCLMHKAMRK